MAIKKSGKKKAKKFVEQGVINIQATFNNTIITIRRRIRTFTQSIEWGIVQFKKQFPFN